MYVNDITLYANLEDFTSSELDINLKKLNSWLKINKLSLIVEKTKFMIFSRRKNINSIVLSRLIFL